MNAATSPNNPNHLLYVHDYKHKRKWLVDGGAVLSIIPPTLAQRARGPTNTQLQAANGTKIKCYGVQKMVITIANRTVKFPITIADVSQPILGSDFLAHAYLAPNHRDGTLLDLRDFTVLKADVADRTEPIRINFVEQASDPCYQLLDQQFPKLSTPSFCIKEVEHGVRHFIPTDGPPVQSKARKLSPEKLAVAKAELEKLVALGVCERGKSNWSSPLLVTTKPCNSPCTCEKESPCGGWRVCGDYRRLNNMTVPDRYPVRNLQDFNNDLRGKKYFSKVDLLKGYHQIPVNGPDIKKTAVITPFGLFLFPRCPFGLINAGQDFQRLMDEIMGDIPHVFVYLDDILIASSTLEEHLDDLKKVFTILEKNGLVVNRKKCVLGKPSLEFLGHLVDSEGIRPLPEKVKAIVATKPPNSIKQLQRFHGMVNYYRRFIHHAAHHLCSLFNALQGKPKKLEWTDDLQKSFDAIKQALASATMLHHPDPSLPLALTTDASDVAMGGVVEQRGPNGWEPLGFFSKKLTDSQQNWCPYDRELNAVHKGIRHFKHMLEGRHFTIYTDHQSLIPSMSKKTDAPTARQTNQLSEIAEYSTDIRFLEGKSNVVADCLSRPCGEEEKSSARKQAPKVSNIGYVIPEVHPFRQAILDMQKSERQDEDSSEDDSLDWDDMQARYDKLLQLTSTPPSNQKTASESTRVSTKGQKDKGKAKSVTFSPDIAISMISRSADARQVPEISQEPLPPTTLSISTKQPNAAADCGQTKEASKMPSVTLISPPQGVHKQQSRSTSTAKPALKHLVKPSIELPASTQTPVPFPKVNNSRDFEKFILDMHEKPEQRLISLPDLSKTDDRPDPSPTDAKEIKEINKIVPDEKLQDLQMVINSIDHYQLDLQEMARQQVFDPDFRRISTEARTGLTFRKIKVGDAELFVDVSNGPARPFVPQAWRRRVFDIIHGLGHPGVARTRQAVTAKFVWPSVNADVTRWARHCLDCQRAKVNRHTVAPIGDFEVPAKRFTHIHADLVTMPPSNSFTHLLTIVDRHSRWPVAIPVKDIAADTILDAFAHGWIAQYGVPETVTTDRGSQFTSHIWKELLQVWGCKHITTTAYHPEANGMVERLHRRLKESLMALGNGERNRWFWKLPMTLLALRTTVKADLNASPSDLVYGDAVAVPGQLLPSTPISEDELLRRQRATLSNLRMEVERLQPVPTSAHRRPSVHMPDELDSCTHVFILRGGVQPTMTTPYEGPYRVIQKTPQGFRVEFPGRGSDMVAIARLRPAITSGDDPANDNDDSRDDDDIVPPSPPPPGRRPGWRTRPPAPTTRVTRSQRHASQSTAPQHNEPTRSQPSQPRDNSSPLSTQQNASDEQSQESVDNHVQTQEPFDDPDPLNGHVPPDENLAACPCDPPSGPCGPETRFSPPRQIIRDTFANASDQPSTSTNNQGGVAPRKNTPSFSKPKPGNFSYRRRKPDVSALQKLIEAHFSTS